MEQPGEYLALYRPIDNFDLGWGVKVTDAGYTNIRPGEVYPPSHHPESFMFTWEKGRRLSHYQVIFIGRGGGELETEHGGIERICAGDVFLLHPGEWHRYRPDPNTGWTERWCGLSGAYIEHVFGAFFPVSHPVVRGTMGAVVRLRLRRISRFFLDGRTVCVPELVAEAIGLLTEVASHVEDFTRPFSKAIAASCDEMVARLKENIDLEDLARRNGMGYTLFRRRFKEQTGFSPHAYVLEMRVNRACALLRDTLLTVEEIGLMVGFSSISYFSQVFRRRFSLSPSEWRTCNRVKNIK